MRLFEAETIREGMDHADAGGQTLVVIPRCAREGPACFHRYPEYAYLFDCNEERLRATARRLGVRVVKIHGVRDESRRGQHVDLCGGPLAKAREEAVKA